MSLELGGLLGAMALVFVGGGAIWWKHMSQTRRFNSAAGSDKK